MKAEIWSEIFLGWPIIIEALVIQDGTLEASLTSRV